MRRCVTVAFSVMTACTVAAADTGRSVRPLGEEHLAVRGGVLMVPLETHRPAEGWPERLAGTLEDGRRLEGPVAWLHIDDAAAADGGWTADPRGLAWRRIDPEDSREAVESRGWPHCLLRLPEDGAGHVQMGGRRLRLRWLDRPEAPEAPGAPGGPDGPDGDTPVAEKTGPLLPLERRPDRPDPRSPFEFWRWALIAENLDVAPPEALPYGEIGRKIAEHSSDLWSSGMARLASHSPGVASHLADLLTAVAHDRLQAFAVWPSDPVQLNRLLMTLLDESLAPERVGEEVVQWIDRHERLLLWTEAEHGGHVRLALVNTRRQPVVARLTWAGRDEIPLAVELPPRRLKRVTIERPVTDEAALRPLQDRRDVLHVHCGDQALQIALNPRRFAAAPPALLLPPARPALTLNELWTGRARAVSAERMTIAQVRRRAGRWELFIEARRPQARSGEQPNDKSTGPAAAPGGRLRGIDSDEARRHGGTKPRREEQLDRTAPAHQDRSSPWPSVTLRDESHSPPVGTEAIGVVIGTADEDGGPVIHLWVPEEGWHRVSGGGDDEALQVHRRSFADRWYCRIVLPPSWLDEDDALLEVGVVRTHGGIDRIDFTPGSAAPWRAVPGRIAVDLSRWGGLPGER